MSGRTTDLVRTATQWVARYDDTELQVRDQGNGTWVAYDGQGRTFTFGLPSPALAGTGIWLLQDITASGGGKVHLDYVIGAPTVSGNAALTIDLTRVSYNPNRDDAGCYKNAVQLNYDAELDPPLSISLIGTKLLARRHKLQPSMTGSAVDILATESCPPSYVPLRRYKFTYAPDGDTAQDRLQQVQVFGRDGTDEASTPITVAKYSYGTAIANRQLTYGSMLQGDSASAFSLSGLDSMQQIGALAAGSGSSVGTLSQYVDVTGDGRPDRVQFISSGQLNVYKNYSTVSTFGFRASTQLSDTVLAPRAPGALTTHTAADGGVGVVYNRVWRQAIDVNGDGRVDIVDAAEQSGHWVVYLNTPDATDPSTVHWQRRSFSVATLAQQLASRGMTENGFIPLSRTAIGSQGSEAQCWEWFQTGSKPSGRGEWRDVTGVEPCNEPQLPFFANQSIKEWELRDVNGDGYPDVVFNSAPTVMTLDTVTDHRGSRGAPGEVELVVLAHNVRLRPSGTHNIDAMLNVLGTRLIDAEVEVFSSPVTLRSGDLCGIERWVPDWGTSQTSTSRHMECGIADVNGDGVVDRISGTSVFLGIGNIDGSGFFTSAATMSLPGPLANEANNIRVMCHNGGTAFASDHKARLIDLTGDGIPDYVTATGTGTGWEISVGKGTGFAGAIPIMTGFTLNTNSDSCTSTTTSTAAGLIDIDGDGRPELFNFQHQLLALTGSDGVAGAPSAGRLISVDNGFGAVKNIHYRSIKGDTTSMHQVPFAEIVVDSVDTSTTAGLGNGLAATRYAYGGAELIFDPAHDHFIFPGYRRTITLQTPEAQRAGFGAFVVSDSYAPVSAVDPYGIAGATVTLEQRYALFRRFGRPRDVTVLSGDIGAAALADPSQLLGVDVTSAVSVKIVVA